MYHPFSSRKPKGPASFVKIALYFKPSTLIQTFLPFEHIRSSIAIRLISNETANLDIGVSPGTDFTKIGYPSAKSFKA